CTGLWGILMAMISRGKGLNRLQDLAASAMLAMLCSVGPAIAEEGVTADTITFRQAAVLEGPASALGIGMRTGLQAAFDEINKKGGIHGRKLKLVSVDDGYEPDKSIVAVRKLIEQDKVF